MNVNKLYKMLSKTKEDFATLDKYRNVLNSTARVTVDFSGFKDFAKMAEIAKPIATSGGVVFPFDNVMFDILGLAIPNPVNGKVELQPLMLHTVPIKITTDISTFHIMLVQDMRQFNGQIFARSHVVSLEKELAVMPAVDEGMPAIGCKCYERNPMSMSMLFKQIQSFTPGFVADCGFASPICKSTLKPCQQLLQDSRQIVDIVIGTMTYALLPCHVIVKVQEPESSDKDLKQKPYYVVCDEASFINLTTKGFPLQSKIQDSEAFNKALTESPLSISGTFTRGPMTYEIIQRPTQEEIEAAKGDGIDANIVENKPEVKQ
jgi:hypothetical protein